MKMQEGAIAMVDALGIKGIWRGADGAEDTNALATLKTVADTAHGMKRYLKQALIPRVVEPRFALRPKVQVLAFSDTIVVAALPPARVQLNESLGWTLLNLVCHCAAYVMRYAAESDPPLAYRGAVNYGRFLIQGSFLLGPAVDELADAYESADGAFVWLMPAAAGLVPRPYPPNVWRTMAFRYEVPMKDGRRITTTALSPFVDNSHRSLRGKIRDGYNRAMHSTRSDVVIKHQNTLQFLDHLDEVQREETR